MELLPASFWLPAASTVTISPFTRPLTLPAAVNAVPSVYPWPDLLITTNQVPVVEVYTNIPYQVELSRSVQTIATPRAALKVVTNDICSVTLSQGFKTNAVNCVFAPGETVLGSGTAFPGGRIQLILER